MAQTKLKIDTTYQNNLKAAPIANTQIANVQNSAVSTEQPVAVDTSYQNNTASLYGGHDANWWQQQYSNQSSGLTKNMIKKAADYYGYKIDENIASNTQNLSLTDRFKNSISAVGTYGAYLRDKAASNSRVAPTAVSAQEGVQQSSAQSNSQSQTQESPATPVTTDSEPIDSYEEFLRKREQTYQDTLDKQTATIEEQKQKAIEQAELQRQQTEQNAENERQRSVIDARSDYEQNKASYGANAETLAGMGLTQSGYSDYLNAQAYATQRAETQNANAQSETTKQNAKYIADATKLEAEQNASENKLNAELSYAENVANNDATIAQYQLQKQEEQKAAYTELLSYANNGTYSEEQIKELASKYNLSEEDTASLQNAALEYKNNQYKENYANAIDNITNYGSTLDDKYLDNLLEMDLISEEQYNDLQTKYNEKVSDEISENISSGDSETIEANINNADKYYSEGKITQESYQKIYNDYSSNAIGGVSNIDDYQSVKKTLDEYKSSGKISQSQYNSLLNQMKTKTTKSLNSSKYSVQGLSVALDKTDDIDVKINGVTYDLVSNKRVSEDSTKSLLNEVATGSSGSAPSVGTVVVVCGKMYIYKKYKAFGFIGGYTGWYEMGNDSSKVADAVKAYMNQ